jgi:hypothetical protein
MKLFYFKKPYGYQKTQNMILIPNTFKNLQKTHAKKFSAYNFLHFFQTLKTFVPNTSKNSASGPGGESREGGDCVLSPWCTKEDQIFLIFKAIQSGAVAKSYTNGLLIYGEIFAHFLIY